MKKLKVAFHIVLVIVFAVLLAALITGGMILLRGMGTTGSVSHVIVLGTTVEGTEPSPMLSDRIQAAARYLEKNPDVTCIVTGSKADETNISEAQCMYNGLVELGIAPERILMEDKATTTVENFQYSVELLKKELGRDPKKVGVLSSEFHLLRASMLAGSHGVEAVTIPANTSDAKIFATYFVREILMVWYDGLKIALK